MSKYCFEEGDMYGALEWAILVYNKWTDGDRPDCVAIENVINNIILSSLYVGKYRLHLRLLSIYNMYQLY